MERGKKGRRKGRKTEYNHINRNSKIDTKKRERGGDDKQTERLIDRKKEEKKERYRHKFSTCHHTASLGGRGVICNTD